MLPAWRSLLVPASLCVAFAIAAEPCNGQAAGQGAQTRPDYRIVGYLSGRVDIPNIQAEKLTNLIYGFAEVRDSGEVYLPLLGFGARGGLAELCNLKARNPTLKVDLSVGGWGLDHFSNAALTDATRREFARSGAALVETYQLDGLDIDWEYPGQPGGGCKFRPEDKRNFTLLLQAVRERLDALSLAHGRVGPSRYTLSIASSDSEYFDHTEMPILNPYLDWINVMTYDFYGSLTPTTGHHAALRATRGAPPNGRCAAFSIEQHLAAGIPASKLVLGAAFYGKSWRGVSPVNHGVLQSYAKFGKWIEYRDLVADYIGKDGFQRFWDDQAKAPYLWNPETHVFISYEDEDSLKEKVAYVKERHLGGIMFWQVGGDRRGDLVGAIYNGFK
jgi:chitinase